MTVDVTLQALRSGIHVDRIAAQNTSFLFNQQLCFLGVAIEILQLHLPCVVSVSRGFQTMPVAPKGRGAGPIFRELPWQDGSMSCLLFL